MHDMHRCPFPNAAQHNLNFNSVSPHLQLVAVVLVHMPMNSPKRSLHSVYRPGGGVGGGISKSRSFLLITAVVASYIEHVVTPYCRCCCCHRPRPLRRTAATAVPPAPPARPPPAAPKATADDDYAPTTTTTTALLLLLILRLLLKTLRLDIVVVNEAHDSGNPCDLCWTRCSAFTSHGAGGL